MKNTLVVGLGNTLCGDDGVGVRIVESLSRNDALKKLADFVVVGDDLLRAWKDLEGRRHAILIDAMTGDPRLGAVEVHSEPFAHIDTTPSRAHFHSVVECVRLLKGANPRIAPVHFTILGVLVDTIDIGEDLTPAMQDRLPWVLRVVGDYLRGQHAA